MDNVIREGEKKRKAPKTAEESMTKVREYLANKVEDRDRVFLVTSWNDEYPEVLEPEYIKMIQSICKDVVETRRLKSRGSGKFSGQSSTSEAPPTDPRADACTLPAEVQPIGSAWEKI